MRKRVINAKNSELGSFDARHAKANVISLMTIVIHYNNMLKKHSNNENELNNNEIIKDLIKLFSYYYELIETFIKNNETKHKQSIKRSLSIFSKCEEKKDNSHIQYNYSITWINKLSNYFFATNNTQLRNNVTNDILKDYYISNFINKYDEKNMKHYSFFNISLEELNKSYDNDNINIEMFI
jgi:hypothetical protein